MKKSTFVATNESLDPNLLHFKIYSCQVIANLTKSLKDYILYYVYLKFNLALFLDSEGVAFKK